MDNIHNKHKKCHKAVKKMFQSIQKNIQMSNGSVNIVIYFHQLEILIVKLFFKTVVFAWLNPVKYSASLKQYLYKKQPQVTLQNHTSFMFRGKFTEEKTSVLLYKSLVVLQSKHGLGRRGLIPFAHQPTEANGSIFLCS